MAERVLKILAPILLGIAVLLIWETLVREREIQVFVLPGPVAVFESLKTDGASLLESTWITFRLTVIAFCLATVGAVTLAVIFVQSPILEWMFYPYAVVLQVTPVIAIAPIVLIWVGLDHAERALLILACIVAFFPILASTTLGLRSTDPGLRELYALYGASRWQRLVRLQFPTALPYLLNGMKVSGGLSLIGVVVAEFVAGTGSASGLAWRITEAGNRLQIPKMFAALFLLSALGVVIFLVLSAAERAVLRKWHESWR